MKRLLVTLKSSSEVLEEFAQALKAARAGRLTTPPYEISFDSQKRFDYFIRNMSVRSAIRIHKPTSVYALAKLLELDVSNLNKLIQFFEQMGAVRIKRRRVNGRMVKTPVVDYDRIEFVLKAA